LSVQSARFRAPQRRFDAGLLPGALRAIGLRRCSLRHPASAVKTGALNHSATSPIVVALEARCARWLLMTHDRLQEPELPLTQEALAEMFGVARTYVTRIAHVFQQRGAISYRRGIIRIERRSVLEQSTCECYGLVRRHFERVLPGLYPTKEP